MNIVKGPNLIVLLGGALEGFVRYCEERRTGANLLKYDITGRGQEFGSYRCVYPARWFLLQDLNVSSSDGIDEKIALWPRYFHVDTDPNVLYVVRFLRF